MEFSNNSFNALEGAMMISPAAMRLTTFLSSGKIRLGVSVISYYDIMTSCLDALLTYADECGTEETAPS